MRQIQTKNAKTFSERLLARRNELGLKQLDLAEMTQISRPAITSYEMGLEPNIEKVAKLADGLDVTPEWLAFGVGERGGVPQYRTEGGSLEKDGLWGMNANWLETSFGENLTLCLVEVRNSSGKLNEDDLALVVMGAKPTVASDEFAMIVDDEMLIARVTKQRDGKFRVFENNGSAYQTYSDKEIEFVGKVVGGIIKT